MLTGNPTSDDSGATAIIVAITLLLLCGMAALAVDLGLGFRERRFDQGGADSAALGGSLEMVITNQPNPVRAAITEVHQLVNLNLGRTVPQADWGACTDPGALYWKTKTDGSILGTTTSPDIGSDCISLSENFNTLRVRIPNQGVDTTFGAAIGFAEIDVSAAAEAARNTNWGGGGDFPSGVLSSAQVGDQLCLKTGPQGQESSCAPSSTGDFGTFQPYFYSAVDGDISTICVSGEQKAPLARSMADGIDHEFSGHNFSMVNPNNRTNGLWCQQSGVPGPPFPNRVNSGAGSTADDATWGLVSGEVWPTPYDGRLERSYADGSATIYGNNVDNRPLWSYIDPATTIPSCQVAATWGSTITPPEYQAAIDQTIDCIKDAGTSPPTVVFTPDILTTTRLVHAPLFWEQTKRPNNSCCYHIKGLVPVFIDGVWADSSHPSFTCDFIEDAALQVCIHRPGLVGSMDVNPPGQKTIQSASGILLSCAILPSGTCPTIQDGTNPLNFLYDLQLTR